MRHTLANKAIHAMALAWALTLLNMGMEVPILVNVSGSIVCILAYIILCHEFTKQLQISKYGYWID